MSARTSTRTFLPQALRYAAFGFAVFPCAPRDKVPLLPRSKGGNGFHDATTDETRIRQWWTRAPLANIGLFPGSAGYVVLDVDDPTASDYLEDRFGVRVADHPCVVTTARGWHLYFRAPAGVEFGNRKVEKGRGIDVRAHHGYVLAPPSIHPTGKVYRWTTLEHLENAPVLPGPIVTALATPPALPTTIHAGADAPLDRRVTAYLERLPTGLADGGGRKATAYLFSKFMLHTLGLASDLAWGHLVTWNALNAAPLKEYELRRKMDEAAGVRSRKAA